MGAERIELGPEAAGTRLDRLLADRQRGLGRAAVRRLIEAGQVLIDGRRGRAGTRLWEGAVLELRDWPESTAATPDPELALSVLHEDGRLLVVDKPAGVPTHPLRAGERGTLAGALLARYPELAGVGHGEREPGLLHRLDTDTSGLLLVARDTESFARLQALLQGGGLDKRYEALCAGQLTAPTSERAWLSARGSRVTVRGEAFRHAVEIETEVLESAAHGDFSLVQLRAHLARRHQLRAHLAFLAHPIAADALYGGPPVAGLKRHYLHANFLAFEHPFTGERVAVDAPRPEALQGVLDTLSTQSSPEAT